MFIADDPSLDFLNSIGTPAGTVIEWLANGEDLLAWLEQAKLIDSAIAAAIRANSFPGELDEVAAQARALREWFRDFVLTHMGRPLTAKALDLLEADVPGRQLFTKAVRAELAEPISYKRAGVNCRYSLLDFTRCCSISEALNKRAGGSAIARKADAQSANAVV